MNIKDETIVITGGAGFIGSYTAEALLLKGAKVIIIDNLSTGREENIPKKAVFVEMNIADPKISEVFEKYKPSYVYHFAFNVNVPGSVKNPLIELESIEGSLRIFEASKVVGVKRLIFASSEFVYGNTENLPAKETEPFDPVAPYAISKYTVENYLKYYANTSNMQAVIFRYSTVYGPRQKKGAMTDYIRQLSTDRQAEFWGDGEKTRDYLYISDVVEANLLALTVALNRNHVFNLGRGEETSLNQLYELIADKLGKKPKPIYHPDRPGEKNRSSLDSSRFRKLSGWKPKVSLSEGLDIKITDFLAK